MSVGLFKKVDERANSPQKAEEERCRARLDCERFIDILT